MANEEMVIKIKDLKWIVQTIHQAYHETGTWDDCPKVTCDFVGQLIVAHEMFGGTK